MALIENKKAKFDYETLDEFEAGLELFGHEVKALKNGRGNLTGSYVAIRGGEAFLIGAEIMPYQASNVPDNFDSKRPRRLLLSKKEIMKLADFEAQRGLTLVPISVYNKGRNLKISFIVGRGKRKTDKRQTIMRREAEREIHRSLKKRR